MNKIYIIGAVFVVGLLLYSARIPPTIYAIFGSAVLMGLVLWFLYRLLKTEERVNRI